MVLNEQYDSDSESCKRYSGQWRRNMMYIIPERLYSTQIPNTEFCNHEY